jgi:hypothetical protein
MMSEGSSETGLCANAPFPRTPYRKWRNGAFSAIKDLATPRIPPQDALQGRALKRPPPLFGGGLPAQGI